MHVNRPVVVAVVGVTATTLFRTYLLNQVNPNKQVALTPIIIGAYVVLLVLAVLDLFGGALSQIAGDIALLALFTTILTQFPWTSLTGVLTSQQKKAGA